MEMVYPYIEVLTQQERATAIAAGMCKIASEKSAQICDIMSAGKDAIYAYLAAAVAAGVPIGLALHKFKNESKGVRADEMKRLGTIDQYLDAAERLSPETVS
jgi:hypothetical protein